MSNKTPTIGVDLYGSEYPLQQLLEAIFNLELKENVYFIFFGTSDLLTFFEEKKPKLSNCSFSYFPTEERIEMDEDPIIAIKEKKKSSLFQGLKHLKEHKIDAFISFGNTGALLSASQMLLEKLPGISRLALLALVPTKKNLLAILDVGANISKRPTYLLQFAKLGIAFQKYRQIKKPKLALLNIGIEESKGGNELKETYKELQQLSNIKKDFTFVGNIEGNRVFDGDIDVLITDGFSGNILLKTSEGLANFILDYCNQLINDQSIFSNIKKHLHYEEYPGAILCGVEKIIIKCHGYSSPKALETAILGALELYHSNFISSIKEFLLKK